MEILVDDSFHKLFLFYDSNVHECDNTMTNKNNLCELVKRLFGISIGRQNLGPSSVYDIYTPFMLSVLLTAYEKKILSFT